MKKFRIIRWDMVHESKTKFYSCYHLYVVGGDWGVVVNNYGKVLSSDHFEREIAESNGTKKVFFLKAHGCDHHITSILMKKSKRGYEENPSVEAEVCKVWETDDPESFRSKLDWLFYPKVSDIVDHLNRDIDGYPLIGGLDDIGRGFDDVLHESQQPQKQKQEPEPVRHEAWGSW